MAALRLAKNDAEDHHCKERLKYRPGSAQSRLLISNLDVPPGKEEQQFPIAPQIPKVEGNPTRGWLDKDMLAPRSHLGL